MFIVFDLSTTSAFIGFSYCSVMHISKVSARIAAVHLLNRIKRFVKTELSGHWILR